jgi:hypothetical protein
MIGDFKASVLSAIINESLFFLIKSFELGPVSDQWCLLPTFCKAGYGLSKIMFWISNETFEANVTDSCFKEADGTQKIFPSRHSKMETKKNKFVLKNIFCQNFYFSFQITQKCTLNQCDKTALQRFSKNLPPSRDSNPDLRFHMRMRWPLRHAAQNKLLYLRLNCIYNYNTGVVLRWNVFTSRDNISVEKYTRLFVGL